METPWLARIAALLDPVQFDRDPLDGLDRVFLRTFRAGTPPDVVDDWRRALAAALASETPLGALIPLTHDEARVRAYLEAVVDRLDARFPGAPPPPAPDSPALSGLFLAACDAVERGTPEAEALVDALAHTLLYAIGDLEASDMDEGLTRRDLELQALGLLMDGCLALGEAQPDFAELRRQAAEAELMLLRAATLVTD